MKDNKDNSLHLGWKYALIFVLGHYLFLEALVFLELHSRKTVHILEEIMSVDKYQSIFSLQMEAIVYIIDCFHVGTWPPHWCTKTIIWQPFWFTPNQFSGDWSLIKETVLYTCQLFQTQRHDIFKFITICGITSLISENAWISRPLPKIYTRQSKRFQRCSEDFRILTPSLRHFFSPDFLPPSPLYTPATQARKSFVKYVFSFENRRIFCGRTDSHAHFSICYSSEYKLYQTFVSSRQIWLQQPIFSSKA